MIAVEAFCLCGEITVYVHRNMIEQNNG